MSATTWKQIDVDWVIEVGTEHVAQVYPTLNGKWCWWALGSFGTLGHRQSAMRAAERALVARGKALVEAGGGK